MFGHSVKEIDRTNQRIVVVETAMSGAVMMFAVFTLMGAFFQDLIGAALAVIFGAMAVYSGISSTFIADRNLGTLVVKRRIVLWTVERLYSTDSIDRVYARDYGRNGRGLCLRFRSGKKKRLTTCSDWLCDLESVAGALNHYLYTTHRGKRSRA
jgi:hypothetical protein